MGGGGRRGDRKKDNEQRIQKIIQIKVKKID
jgi:hypothetical protein